MSEIYIFDHQKAICRVSGCLTRRYIQFDFPLSKDVYERMTSIGYVIDHKFMIYPVIRKYEGLSLWADYDYNNGAECDLYDWIGCNSRKCQNNYVPGIKDYKWQDKVTTIIWDDGTKTVVKPDSPSTADQYTGFAIAIAKKAMGNDNSLGKLIDEWTVKRPKKLKAERAKLEAEKKARIAEDKVRHIRNEEKLVKKKLDELRINKKAKDLLKKENI